MAQTDDNSALRGRAHLSVLEEAARWKYEEQEIDGTVPQPGAGGRGCCRAELLALLLAAMMGLEGYSSRSLGERLQGGAALASSRSRGCCAPSTVLRAQLRLR